MQSSEDWIFEDSELNKRMEIGHLIEFVDRVKPEFLVFNILGATIYFLKYHGWIETAILMDSGRWDSLEICAAN